MPPLLLPPLRELTICFAHVAYQMAERFAARNTGLAHVQVRNPEDLRARLPQADVVVVSMMWRNELIDIADRLRFIQSISAGVEQYDTEKLRAKGIRLASASGVNAQAVAEHAMALMLALARQLHTGRDHQAARHWRAMIADPSAREDELGGKTLLIIGMGRIGARLAKLAKAFDMKVATVRRNPGAGAGAADAVYGTERLLDLLPAADVVALTCGLTPETENLIDAQALGAMKPSAHLVNVARGRVVDEAALIAALSAGRIGAAALDCTREEPLPAASPLWAMANVIITPHTAGETSRYEDNVIDILLDNLDRLWRAQTSLRNEIV